MRLNLLAVAVLLGGACTAEPGQDLLAVGELPLQLTVHASVSKNADPNVTLTVGVRNLGKEPLALRMNCTIIQVDQDQGGEWKRFGDFRLCAPPDRTTLLAGATLTTADQRSLSPGVYRVAVEEIDGRTAVSEPFTVDAVR